VASILMPRPHPELIKSESLAQGHTHRCLYFKVPQVLSMSRHRHPMDSLEQKSSTTVFGGMLQLTCFYRSTFLNYLLFEIASVDSRSSPQE
jgi:hypothetical protein